MVGSPCDFVRACAFYFFTCNSSDAAAAAHCDTCVAVQDTSLSSLAFLSIYFLITIMGVEGDG